MKAPQHCIFFTTFCISLFCLLGIVSSPIAAQDISFGNLTTDDGLSQFTVYALYNDERGQLWIGTRDGINVYNGGRIKTYKPKKGDSNTLLGRSIKKITGNDNGMLYILTKEGVTAFDMTQEKFRRLVDNREMEKVNAFAYYDKKLYLGTYGMIYVWDEATETQMPFCRLPEQELPNCMLRDNKGQWWVGSHRNGLYKISPDGEVVRHWFPNCQIFNLYQDSVGNIWTCTWTEGVYCIRTDNEEVVHYKKTPGSTQSLADNSVRDVCEDSQGNLWIGTEKGLDKLDVATGSLTHYQSAGISQGTNNFSVFCLLKDRLGTCWAGTYFGGVYYFNPGHEICTHYKVADKESDGLSASIIGSIIEGDDDELWIATDGGGLNRYNRRTRKFTWYRHQDGANSLSQNIVKSLYHDRAREVLWIGTHQGGLNKLDLRTGHFSKYCIEAGKDGDVIMSIVRITTTTGFALPMRKLYYKRKV